jgi:hypothetical protein
MESSPMNGGSTLKVMRGNRAEGNFWMVSATKRNHTRAIAEFGSAYKIDSRFVNPKET